MKQKTNLKLLLILGVVLVAMLLLGTNVNAVEEIEEELKGCFFTIHNVDGTEITHYGQGDAGYEELGCDLKELTKEGYYFQLSTEINLGKSVTLKGLGNFTLLENDNGVYIYKSETKSVNNLDKKVQELEFNLKDIDTNKIYNFVLKLTYMGEVEKTYSINDKETGIGIYLNGTTELGVSLKADTIKDNTETYIKMKNKLDISNGSLLLRAYDISLVGGNYRGNLQIKFNLGTEYNGRKVIVLHKKQNGDIEKFEETVVKGEITVSVNELSPFMLAIEEKEKPNNNQNTNSSETQPNTPTSNNKPDKKLDDTPKTGEDHTVIIISSMLSIISVAGIAIIKKF